MSKRQSRVIDSPLLMKLFRIMESKRILMTGVTFFTNGNWCYEIANSREITNSNIDCKAIAEEHQELLQEVQKEIQIKVGFPCFIREDANLKLFYKV